jgi:hypothetical protein
LSWLPVELDTWLDVVDVQRVELKSNYEFIALFNEYYIDPSSTSGKVICVAPTRTHRIMIVEFSINAPYGVWLISGSHTSNYY